jgi:hypothetical protein
MIVNRVKNNPNFDEKSLIKRSGVQNVFFHYNSLLIGFKEYEKVWFQQFIIYVVWVWHVLLLLNALRLHEGFRVDIGAVDPRHRYDLKPLLEAFDNVI